MSEWQPIETAPSGRAVLIYYTNQLGKGRTIKARHIKRFTEESNDNADEGVDEYDEANDRYTYVEGWWEMLDNWDEYGFVKVYSGTPTHWHPLPDPPAST